MKFSAIRRKTIINTTIAVLTVASIIIVFSEYLFPFPLNVEQIWAMYGFDLIVSLILAADFAYRLKSSNRRLKFIIAHWYEFPAMIPLVVYATADSYVNYSKHNRDPEIPCPLQASKTIQPGIYDKRQRNNSAICGGDSNSRFWGFRHLCR